MVRVCPRLRQHLVAVSLLPDRVYNHCEIVVFFFFIPENEQINRYRLCYYAPSSLGQFVAESLSVVCHGRWWPLLVLLL